jgi:hypothetical protein
MNPPSPEQVAEVQALIGRIGDPAERALVSEVLDCRLHGRRLPSWCTMSPLMQVAALTLNDTGQET